MRRLITAALGLALLALARPGAAAADQFSIPELLKGLREDAKPVRLRSARELGNQGAAAREAVPALGGLLREGRDREERIQAGKALAQIGPPAVAELIGCLKHEDALVRRQAALALGRIGPDAAEAVLPLADLLGDKQPEVRGASAYALGEIGPAAKDLSLLLVEHFADEPAVRVQAVAALVKMGAPAVPFLATALRDPKVGVRYWAALALGMGGPEAGEAVPALTENLKDKNPAVRQAAAAALGSIGPGARAAVPALVGALKDRELQGQAAGALVGIGPAASPEVIGAMRDANPSVRGWALRVLAEVGGDNQDTAPALIEALKDRNQTVRLLAVAALERLGRRSREVVDALVQALRDNDPQVRFLAASALGRMGSDARQAAAALSQALQDPTPMVRLVAVVSLLNIQPDEQKELQILQNQLRALLANLPTPPQVTAAIAAGARRPVDPTREARFDQALDLFIAVEGADMHSRQAKQAEASLNQMGPEAIPAIVRAWDRYSAWRINNRSKDRLCPDTALSSKISDLINHMDDPYLIYYIEANLGKGAPLTDFGVRNDTNRLRAEAWKKLYALYHPTLPEDAPRQLLWKIMQHPPMTLTRFPVVRDVPLSRPPNKALTLRPPNPAGPDDEAARQAVTFLQTRLALRREIYEEGPGTLRERLKDVEPEVRLVAIQVIAARRLPLEKELINRLGDRDMEVRQAARQALVRLSRGTDFGPAPTASRAQRADAVRRWNAWLALQEPREKGFDLSAALTPIPVSRPAQLISGEESSPNVEAARLARELVQSPADRQAQLLGKYRENQGETYTQALAQAAPQLPPDLGRRAREILAERLERLSSQTLRSRFLDEDDEVRRAAALAAGKRGEEALIPDLIELLDDPELLVAQGARAALKSLSGEDYGPEPGTGRAEHVIAVAAWYGWWEKQKAGPEAGGGLYRQRK